MSNVTLQAVPDSEVTSPLVFLPPQIAREIAMATYIHIGATSVLVWDVANNLRNDYRILVHCRIGLQTAAYMLAKITLLAYALGRAVLITSPIADCGKFEVAMNGVLMAYVITITFTFYLRVYAIYRDKLFVKVVYGLLWLSVVGVSGTFAKTFSATHLGPTRYCLESVNDKYLQPLAIILLTNDTLIYIGITYRLYTLFLDIESSTQQKLKLVVFGTSLPIFSKAVLQDSQLYFLIIVCTKAFLVYTTRNLSPPMNVMYVICHLVLVNTLSGRIFRTIKMNCDRWERPLEPDIGPGMDFAANSSFGAVQTRTGLAFPNSSGNTGSHSTDTRLDASEKGVPISDLTPSVVTLESSMR